MPSSAPAASASSTPPIESWSVTATALRPMPAGERDELARREGAVGVGRVRVQVDHSPDDSTPNAAPEPLGRRRRRAPQACAARRRRCPPQLAPCPAAAPRLRRPPRYVGRPPCGFVPLVRAGRMAGASRRHVGWPHHERAAAGHASTRPGGTPHENRHDRPALVSAAADGLRGHRAGRPPAHRGPRGARPRRHAVRQRRLRARWRGCRSSTAAPPARRSPLTPTSRSSTASRPTRRRASST